MRVSKKCKGEDCTPIKHASADMTCPAPTPMEETDPKLEACDHIKAAIDILGSIAKEDKIARDSIANLGVVYFDLN